MKLTKYFWKQWDKKREKTKKNVLLTWFKLNSKEINSEISHGFFFLLVSKKGKISRKTERCH